MESDSSSSSDSGEEEEEHEEGGEEEEDVSDEDDLPALDPSDPLFPKKMYMSDVLLAAAEAATAQDDSAAEQTEGASNGAPAAPNNKSGGTAALTLPPSIKDALSSAAKRKRMVPLGSTLQGNRIGPAMHTGDDEGRAAAKRVRRPPPPPSENDDGSNSNRPRRRDEDEAEEEDDDEQDEGIRGRPRRNPRTRDDVALAAAAAAAAHRPSSSSSRGRSGGGHAEARVRLSPCWLCTFSSTRVAKQIAAFVSSSAGTMDPAIMADQIKRLVLAKYPHALGIGRMTVLRHLREHVLLPNVRMAGIVRSLITLAETLRCTLQQIDDETGEVMIDIKNTELYLKVVSQIHSVYRTDGSKMLFSPAVPGAGASASGVPGGGGGSGGESSSGGAAR